MPEIKTAQKVRAMQEYESREGVNIQLIDSDYVVHSYENHTVEVHIKGLQFLPLDWSETYKQLQTQGVSEFDANFLIDQFVQLTEQHLLAKALATKIKRV